jgi:hypothetical protein
VFESWGRRINRFSTFVSDGVTSWDLGLDRLALSTKAKTDVGPVLETPGATRRQRWAVWSAKLLPWPESPVGMEIRPLDLRWSLGEWKKKKKPKNFIFKLKTMEGNSKCKEIGIFELFEHKKSRARHVAHFPSI